MAIARTCLGCGRIIPTGSRCGVCARPKRRKGSTRAWRTLRQQILQRDGFRCRYCGAPAAHVDHIVPVVRGGASHESNLAASCATCNLEKGAG